MTQPFQKDPPQLRFQYTKGVWWALVGQPVEPEAFLQRSAGCKHPACSLPPLPSALEKVVSSLSSQHLSQIHKLRCQRHQEEQEQAGLEPHLRNILKGKRFRLFETLLTSIDYPDKGLVEDMKRGFRLTGWLPDTQTRPSKVVPPSLHRDEVWEDRCAHNRTIWNLCGPAMLS